MTSKANRRCRNARWKRYIERTSRSSKRHYDYPFGLSVKITPGYFGPRWTMRHRGHAWYLTQRMADEMFADAEYVAAARLAADREQP